MFEVSYSKAARAALYLGLAGIAISVTWPFLVGRWVFHAECRYLAGYSIDEKLDARSEGFFDYRLHQQRELYGVSWNNFGSDIEALAAGRVLYFESHPRSLHWGRARSEVEETLPRYEKFYLADSGAKECVSNSNEFEMRARMMALAPGKCLASQPTDSLKSRYEIRASGYHFTDSRASTEVVDRQRNRTVAKFWSFTLWNPYDFAGDGRDGVCPRYADMPYSPHWTLVSMLYIDRDGQARDLTDLKAEDDENAKRQGRGLDTSGLELHRVRVSTGVPPGSDKDYRVTDVIVTIKKPVMLLLESDVAVYWQVMTTPGADVAVVVTKGPPVLVKARGARYNIKTYHISRIENPEILAFLSTRPASEQEFDQASLVVIDGMSRK